MQKRKCVEEKCQKTFYCSGKCNNPYTLERVNACYCPECYRKSEHYKGEDSLEDRGAVRHLPFKDCLVPGTPPQVKAYRQHCPTCNREWYCDGILHGKTCVEARDHCVAQMCPNHYRTGSSPCREVAPLSMERSDATRVVETETEATAAKISTEEIAKLEKELLG